MHHLFVILEGILFGFTLSLLIGPAFFALLQTSIKRGFKQGLAFAFGVALSDISCIFLTYLGVSQFIASSTYTDYIGIAGGGMLIFFGVYEFVHKDKISHDPDAVYAPRVITYVIKGFFMNLANPFVFILWLTATGVFAAKYGKSITDFILFFGMTITTVFSADTLKAFVANKIKQLLNPKVFLWVHRVAGIILLIFGVVLIYESIFAIYNGTIPQLDFH